MKWRLAIALHRLPPLNQDHDVRVGDPTYMKGVCTAASRSSLLEVAAAQRSS